MTWLVVGDERRSPQRHGGTPIVRVPVKLHDVHCKDGGLAIDGKMVVM
jgi:hypothetical protein